MKVRANISGVYTGGPNGHVSLRAGSEIEVDDATAEVLVGAGIASSLEQQTEEPNGDGESEGGEEPKKPAAKRASKRVHAAPENK